MVFGHVLWECHGVCEYGINSVLLNCICEFAPASFFALFELKEYFTQKLQFAENLFAFSLEQMWRNVALHHLLINRSFVVNGCHQNESPKS